MTNLTQANIEKLLNENLQRKAALRTEALNSEKFNRIESDEFHRLWVKEEMPLNYAKHNASLKAAQEMGYDHHQKISLQEEFKWNKEVLESLPAFVTLAYFKGTLLTPVVQKRWSAEGHSL